MITEFKNEECFYHIQKCEDHFMFADVFQSGFSKTPRKSSICAYGTVLNFENFDKAWETIKNEYSVDCWKEICKYWIYQRYLSPILTLFVATIYRKLGLKLDIDSL